MRIERGAVKTLLNDIMPKLISSNPNLPKLPFKTIYTTILPHIESPIIKEKKAYLSLCIKNWIDENINSKLEEIQTSIQADVYNNEGPVTYTADDEDKEDENPNYNEDDNDEDSLVTAESYDVEGDNITNQTAENLNDIQTCLDGLAKLSKDFNELLYGLKASIQKIY